MDTIPSAAEVVALVDTAGIGALAARLRVTRSQAEMLDTAARRALREGYELPAGSISVGTVRATRAVPAVPPPAPQPATSERERIAERLAWLHDPDASAEQRASAVAEARRQAAYRASVKAGYDEWAPLLVDDGGAA
jgi:hypothetical protein